jgi:hypothetical protein
MIRAAKVIRAIDLALPTTEANQQSACEKAVGTAQPRRAKRPSEKMLLFGAPLFA